MFYVAPLIYWIPSSFADINVLVGLLFFWVIFLMVFAGMASF